MKQMKTRVIGLAFSAAVMMFAPSVFAETIEEKAAFALNADAEDVKVTDVKGKGMKVRFKAHYDGGTYNCYYTRMGVSSDAICSGPIGKKKGAAKPAKGANCNDLLRAAGRC